MDASYLSLAVRAVWTKLKAGSNVAPYMLANNGHYFEEELTSKRPTRITKSDCPAIAMWPALEALTILPATNESFEVRLPLTLQIDVEETSVYTALDLYEIVMRDLWSAWKTSYFGLAGSGRPWKFEPGSGKFAKTYDGPDEQSLVAVSWRSTSSMVLVFRRTLSS